jgi:ABC-2 type transport system permease protein
MKNSKNKLKYGAYSIGLIAVVVIVVILINVFVAFLSQKVDLSFDMTTSANNSLSKENVDILKKFDKDINITVLCDEDSFLSNDFLTENYYIYDSSDGNYAVQAKTFLKEYSRVNKNIKVKYVDSTSPDYASILSKYSTETLNAGDILVECNDSLRIVSVKDLFELEELTYYMGYQITGSNMEAALTSAIITVSGKGPTKAQILTSHNCSDSADLKTLLEGNNFSVKNLDSLDFSDIDDDTKLLVINSPTSDFSKGEINKLKDFLNDENNVLIYVADSTQPALPVLEKYLKNWGIIPMDGVILETDSSRYYNDNYLTFFDYTTDDYEDLKGKGLNCITYAHRPFALVDDKDGYKSQALLQVPSTAILYPMDSNLQEDFTSKGAQKGPFYGVILATKELPDGNSTILAIGSKNFLTSQVMTSGAYGNADFIILTINKALNLEDTDVYFAPKRINTQSGLVDAGMANLIGTWLFMIILPSVTLVLGLYYWIRRRAR